MYLHAIYYPHNNVVCCIHLNLQEFLEPSGLLIREVTITQMLILKHLYLSLNTKLGKLLTSLQLQEVPIEVLFHQINSLCW